ncbi:hypothetical protein D3C80_1684000 [compost metagenome]
MQTTLPLAHHIDTDMPRIALGDTDGAAQPGLVGRLLRVANLMADQQGHDIV